MTNLYELNLIYYFIVFATKKPNRYENYINGYIAFVTYSTLVEKKKKTIK